MVDILLISDCSENAMELLLANIKGFHNKPDLVISVNDCTERSTIRGLEKIASVTKFGLFTMADIEGDKIHRIGSKREIGVLNIKTMRSDDIDYNSVIVSLNPPCGIGDANKCSKVLKKLIDDHHPFIVITTRSDKKSGYHLKYKGTYIIYLSGNTGDNTYSRILLDDRELDVQWKDTVPDINKISIATRKDREIIIGSGINKIEQLISYDLDALHERVPMDRDRLEIIYNMTSLQFEADELNEIKLTALVNNPKIDLPENKVQVNKKISIDRMDLGLDAIRHIPGINGRERNHLYNAGIETMKDLVDYDYIKLKNRLPTKSKRLVELINQAFLFMDNLKIVRGKIGSITTGVNEYPLETIEMFSNQDISNLKSAGIVCLSQLIEFKAQEIDFLITANRFRTGIIIDEAISKNKKPIKRKPVVRKQTKRKLMKIRKRKNTRLGLQTDSIKQIPVLNQDDIDHLRKAGIFNIEQLKLYKPSKVDKKVNELVTNTNEYIQENGVWLSKISLPKEFIIMSIGYTRETMIWILSAKYGDEIYTDHIDDWREERALLHRFAGYLNNYKGVPILYYDGEDRPYKYLWNRASFNDNLKLLENMKNRMWIDLRRMISAKFYTGTDLNRNTVASTMGVDLMTDKIRYRKTDETVLVKTMRLYLDFMERLTQHSMVEYYQHTMKKTFRIDYHKVLSTEFMMKCNETTVDYIAKKIMSMGYTLPDIYYDTIQCELYWTNIPTKRCISMKKWIADLSRS